MHHPFHCLYSMILRCECKLILRNTIWYWSQNGFELDPVSIPKSFLEAHAIQPKRAT